MVKISRRSFIGRMAAYTATAAVAPALSGSILTSCQTQPPKPRKISPGSKVNFACCGIGNRGGEIIKEFAKTGEINVVALCDTDMGAPATQEIISMFPNAKQFQDFRQMFDSMSSQFDAVTVGVPDHSHFPICMTAMQLGKHVYVEKPMARTFHEIDLMMQAAQKYGVATQMGNQGHSDANYFQFKAWKDAGIIKDVTAITAHMNNSRRWHTWDPAMTDFPKGEAIPSTLDWDTWLGTVLYHEYTPRFVNGDWRCWYDFGLGALGDWGAHILDTAHEFLNLGLPTEITPLRLDGHNPFFYPMSTTLAFKFPARGDMPPVDVTWYDGVNNLPPLPAGYGTSELAADIPASNQGEYTPIAVNPGKIIYSKTLTFKGASHGSTLSIIPSEQAADMASKLPEVPVSPSNHFLNFVRACRGEEQTRSPFSIAGPLSQVFALGVIAQRLGTPLHFDPVAGRITNNTVADCLLAPVPRKGWESYYHV